MGSGVLENSDPIGPLRGGGEILQLKTSSKRGFQATISSINFIDEPERRGTMTNAAISTFKTIEPISGFWGTRNTLRKQY